MINALNKSKLFSKAERPEPDRFTIVILGLSITSSWGNGHAITYRGLMAELVRRGHRVHFLERNVPWYADNRDLPGTRYGHVELYSDLDELRRLHSNKIRSADCVIVGSYVPDGIAVGEWVNSTAGGVTAFYDIDTPITLASVERGACEYLTRSVIPNYDLYLSFTGGPTLQRIEKVHQSPMARVLYCAIDPSQYFPETHIDRWDLGYLGTYSDDRQPHLNSLLVDPARLWPDGRFVVAGPQYPESIVWPNNINRIDHLAPKAHRKFYNAQKFTLNITRADMIKAGYSPSIRLFEAAACATPIITDYWPGLESIFRPDEEILVAESAEDVLRFMRDMPDQRRHEIGWNARRRVLREHTAAHRAEALEQYIVEARQNATLGKQLRSS
jgi:spore maturation protein CgeB